MPRFNLKHVPDVDCGAGLLYIMTCRPVAGQRVGKHIPAATNTRATVG
jgi:hypothetical protein